MTQQADGVSPDSGHRANIENSASLSGNGHDLFENLPWSHERETEVHESLANGNINATWQLQTGGNIGRRDVGLRFSASDHPICGQGESNGIRPSAEEEGNGNDQQDERNPSGH